MSDPNVVKAPSGPSSRRPRRNGPPPDAAEIADASRDALIRDLRPAQRRSELKIVFLPLFIMFPGIAATASTIIYLTWFPFDDQTQNGILAFLGGAAIGTVGWVMCAFALRRLSRSDGANPCVYHELVGEYLSMRGRLDAVAANATAANRGSLHEAEAHLNTVADALGVDGASASVDPAWLLGCGYTSVWRRLHRADECLLTLEPEAAVVGAALYDELRVQGARMPKVDSLTQKLRQAIVIMDPASGAYLDHPPRTNGKQHDDEVPAARAVLRAVRHSINEFRDDRRDGLVRARNNLFGTALYTGLVAYLVLGLAMITGAPRGSVASAVACFLVGATVGLFRHLRLASARDTVMEEDYGLATARLIQRPLFSGVAAVGGVILTALIPRLTLSSGEPATGSFDLNHIFQLSVHPEYLVVAAAFGLAPTLLISGLQQQVESYKADLKSSEATESAAA